MLRTPYKKYKNINTNNNRPINDEKHTERLNQLEFKSQPSTNSMESSILSQSSEEKQNPTKPNKKQPTPTKIIKHRKEALYNKTRYNNTYIDKVNIKTTKIYNNNISILKIKTDQNQQGIKISDRQITNIDII